jgi:UDP-glucose 4-epimerase
MAKSNLIFVTGGRGRLASVIADHFRAPAHPIRLFSRTAGFGFADLHNLQLGENFATAGAVLHLAWSTLPATSERLARTEWAEDLPFLERMLTAIGTTPAAAQIHFVFFSSGGTVYGNAPGRPNLESDSCRPIGSYGRAKLAAEQRITEFADRHHLTATILRISNPYGYPVPKSRTQGIIPHALRCAVDGEMLTIWGDGRARKDFLYYTDFLSALDEIIDRRLTGIFNLCAGESHSVHEVIGLVEKHTGRPVARNHQPAPTWDVQDSQLDNRLLVAATGWCPQVSLDEGIRRAAAGYAAP